MAVDNAGTVEHWLTRTLRRYLRGRGAWFVMGVLALLVLNSVRALVLPSSALEAGELVILTGADDSTGRQREQLVQRWNDLHPNNRAHLKEVSDSADSQHSAMVGQAQVADSTVDVYNLDVTWITEFAAAKYIRPLDSPNTEGFLRKPLDTCTINGTLWALPFNTDAGLLYYRTDVLGGAENLTGPLPPSAATVAQMTKADTSLKAGYATQLASYEGLTVNALEAVWAAGGDVVTDDGHVAIDSDKARKGIRGLAQGFDAADGAKPGLWPDSAGAHEKESTAAFASGAVALMRNWPVAYGQLKHPAEQGSGTDISQHFAVAPLPGNSVLGGQDLAIASDTKKPRAAQALIEFLTNDSSERKLFGEGGLAATRDDAYADPAVRQAQPYADILLAAVKSAKRRPVTANYPLFSSVLQTIVKEAFANKGELPVDTVRRLTNALSGKL